MTTTPLYLGGYRTSAIRAFLIALDDANRNNLTVRYPDLLEAAGLPENLYRDLILTKLGVVVWRETEGAVVTDKGREIIAQPNRFEDAALDVIEESIAQSWDPDQIRGHLLMALGSPDLPAAVSSGEASTASLTITVTREQLLRRRRIVERQLALLNSLPSEADLQDDLDGIRFLLGQERTDVDH
ncbi:hypothetical protein [Leifsonia sp. Leaf264]|uniref:hypothetical protein n=1 Tax=Leifsonia sp. Leaf264 TaxID=1736314 RepID=UPI0006FF8801|nr:hypothetical protein [Leifsonia sp. Leaf264]KQO98206.1 hypothetical protein ASF30_09095 [Leifsonia sp. Leaf264]